MTSTTKTARAPRPTWKRLFNDQVGVGDLLEGRRIALALIDENPDQPRRGELPEIDILAESIRRFGLLQPVVVSRRGDGRYQLIAGARRLAAFRHLLATDDEPGRWIEIPAVERDVATEDRLVLALIENLSRHNLSDADTVTALRTLRDLRGWSGSEMARQLGVSPQWINQQFKVAGDPVLSEYVQRGQLTIAKAQEIRTARDERLRQEALTVALSGGTLAEIRRVAKGRQRSTAPGLPGAAPSQAAPGGPAWGVESDFQTPPQPGMHPGPRPGVEPVATAAPEAGARDLVEVARELGLSFPKARLQTRRLLQQADEQAINHLDAAALLQLLRADLRQLEAWVRSQAPTPPDPRSL
ncbi:MAG TPA: ParB/RepB/Spo0J family partition protein [Chloroflexota bacterium]|jgi:ParB family chromosome partitioning protein|nr:ParB/RepB/Spo0J family partition protein [Chloroflexota bacterium]